MRRYSQPQRNKGREGEHQAVTMSIVKYVESVVQTMRLSPALNDSHTRSSSSPVTDNSRVSSKEWIKVCGNSELLDLQLRHLYNKYVCKDHFAVSDLTASGRRKPNVVPCLNLTRPALEQEAVDAWERSQDVATRDKIDDSVEKDSDCEHRLSNSDPENNNSLWDDINSLTLDDLSGQDSNSNVFDELIESIQDSSMREGIDNVVDDLVGEQLSHSGQESYFNSLDELVNSMDLTEDSSGADSLNAATSIFDLDLTLAPEPFHCAMASYNQSSLPTELTTYGQGRQCCAMSLVALSATEILEPTLWDSPMMDEILAEGNRLYERITLGKALKDIGTSSLSKEMCDNLIHKHYQYLDPRDIEVVCSKLTFRNQSVTINVQTANFGFIFGNLILKAQDLLSVLKENLSYNGAKVLLTLKGYTIALWKSQNYFWLFDSHSRDSKCKLVPDGKAFCGSYSSLKDVCCAIMQNFSRDNFQFDITTIAIALDEQLQPAMYPVCQCDKCQHSENSLFIPLKTLESVSVFLRSRYSNSPLSNDPLNDFLDHSEREGQASETEDSTSSDSDSADFEDPKNPARKRKFSSKKWSDKRCGPEIKRISLKEILQNAGQTTSNISPVTMKLAEEVMQWRQFARKQQSTIIHLRQENEKLRSQSARDFLMKKGACENTINLVECEIRNRPRRPRGYRYTDNDKTRSISLERVGGPRALVVAKEYFVSPTLSTVRKSVQAIHLECGFDINGPILKTLQEMASNMSTEEKIVSMIWDETELEKALAMCSKTKKFVGGEDFGGNDRTCTLANKALLFQVQGLFRRWSFPVGFFFAASQAPTPKLINLIPQAITAAQGVGLIVWSTCCDQGSSNVPAINFLERTFPVVENGKCVPGQMLVNGVPIINSTDPSHIIKCFRNMHKNGILEWPIMTVGDQVRVLTLPWSFFKQLQSHLEKCGQTHLARKLTDRHLDPVFKEKMKVKLSTELYSDSNATLSEQVGDDLVPGASEAALVIRDVDTLFDLTNGHSSKEERSGTIKAARQCVSNSSLHQSEFPRFQQSLAGAKFYRPDAKHGFAMVDATSRTPTLKNWKRTLDAIMAIHERAVCEGISDKLNPRIGVSQDGLETTFGVLKEMMRRFNKLTAMIFKNSLRTMIIKNVVAPSNPRGNVELDGINVQDTIKTFLSRSISSEANLSNPNGLGVEVSSQPRNLFEIIRDLELEEYDDPDDPSEEEFPDGSSANDHGSLPLNFTVEDLVDSLDLLPEEYLDVPGDRIRTELLCQRMLRFDTINLSQKLRKDLLKKVDCQECIADLTGSVESSEFSEVMAWEPCNNTLNVPSHRLVQLVEQGVARFDSNCKEFFHCLNIYERVRHQVDDLLVRATDWPSSCLNHRQELMEQLALQLTSLLLSNFMKQTNKKYRKKRKNQAASSENH